MSKYVYSAGESPSACFLELQKDLGIKAPKFNQPDSLYVLDDAFYFFLESLFRVAVKDFDMFEDTHVDKAQWKRIMKLNLEEYIRPEAIDEVRDTLSEIDSWVNTHIDEKAGFIVLGV